MSVRVDRLFFLHIPKTAGSTLHTVIHRNYRKHDYYLYNGIRYPDHLDTLTQEQRDRIRVLKGHIGFGQHARLPGSFEYFTLLRDPTDRVVSHYYQLLRSPGHHFYKEWEKERYTLKQLMDNGKLPFINDMMVRMISGDLFVPYDAIGPEHLEKALRNIDAHFPVVGLQHCFDEFLLLLCERYGWRWPWYRRQQVAKGAMRVRTKDLDAETIAAIKAHNRYDQQLFDIMTARLEKQYADMGEPFAARIRRFKRTNRLIEKTLNALPFVPPPRGD